MLKKIIIGLGVMLAIVVAIVLYLRSVEDKGYKDRGYEMIVQVENFKRLHGKLPQSITDLDIEEPMGTGPYYEQIDSTKYKVYFNIGFDNTLTYYSDTKEWIEGR